MDAKLASVLRQIEQGAVVVDPETMRVTASELRRVCTLLEEAKHAPEMLSRSRIREAVLGRLANAACDIQSLGRNIRIRNRQGSVTRA